MSAPSPLAARASVVLAAVLWSLGSLFIRLFQHPTPLALHDPALGPLQIAFFRALFAGLVMLPLLARRDVRWTPLLVPMVVTFAGMSGVYLSALGLGAAANAIFLQNTAPFWVFLVGVYGLGMTADRRDWLAVLLGLAGAVVIVAGGWPTDLPADRQTHEVGVLALGLGSGVLYAGVILLLRALRDQSTVWLVVLCHLGSAAALALFVLAVRGPAAWADWISAPAPRQLAALVVFGTVQMALPYWLFAHGLRTLSPQEAGLITLIEPLLNPLWAFLISPHTDTPTPAMYGGGGLILLALAWRYLPRGGRPPGAARR